MTHTAMATWASKRQPWPWVYWPTCYCYAGAPRTASANISATRPAHQMPILARRRLVKQHRKTLVLPARTPWCGTNWQLTSCSTSFLWIPSLCPTAISQLSRSRRSIKVRHLSILAAQFYDTKPNFHCFLEMLPWGTIANSDDLDIYAIQCDR